MNKISEELEELRHEYIVSRIVRSLLRAENIINKDKEKELLN